MLVQLGANKTKKIYSFGKWYLVTKEKTYYLYLSFQQVLLPSSLLFPKIQ